MAVGISAHSARSALVRLSADVGLECLGHSQCSGSSKFPVAMKGNCKATAYKDILCNFVILPLWQQFGYV